MGREAEKHDAPTIVSGDFNDVAWSYTTKMFQKASGLLDPRAAQGYSEVPSSKSLEGSRRACSSCLVSVMSSSVITTPSITSSRRR